MTLGPIGFRNKNTEQHLKALNQEQLSVLEQLTAKGPVPIHKLPPVLTHPLYSYLTAHSVFYVGTSCDQFVGEMSNVGSVSVRCVRQKGRGPEVLFSRFRRYAARFPTWDYASFGFTQIADARSRTGQRLAVKDTSLRDVARKLGPLLPARVELRLATSHPAHLMRPTLQMNAADSVDLLNATAAIFGVRWAWLNAQTPRRVALVSARDYVGTAAGIRQSLSQALPPELSEYLVGSLADRTTAVQRSLKRITSSQLQQLERFTASGEQPIAKLPPELALPLKRHLAARSTFQLGLVCDRVGAGVQDWGLTRCGYGKNQFGTKQFSFEGKDAFIAVAPEE